MLVPRVPQCHIYVIRLSGTGAVMNLGKLDFVNLIVYVLIFMSAKEFMGEMIL